MKVPPAVATGILILVSLVWAAHLIAALIVPEYRPDPSLNFVFMTIVGGALHLKGEAESGLASRLLAAVRGPGQPPAPPAPPTPAAPPPERM